MPVSALDSDTLRHYQETLSKLPANRTKLALYKGKSITELVGLSIPAADLLDVKTVNKQITTVSSLLGWAARRDYIARNYAEGLTIGKRKRADRDRDAYDDAEILALKKLFSGILRESVGSHT